MDEIPITWASTIIQLIGLPGLVFIIWHFDNKRDLRKEELREKEISERQSAISQILSQYKEDVAAIKTLYENNAELVRNYDQTCSRLETFYSETIAVISLNTKTQTQLVDQIQSNMYCPLVREKGPNKE